MTALGAPIEQPQQHGGVVFPGLFSACFDFIRVSLLNLHCISSIVKRLFT